MTNSSKQTMQQKVYQELHHSLMVGAFAPGQAISLRKLAESLQTSLMPVREAVNRLIAERAFEMLSNRTVVVPTLDEEKLAELMYWRKVLEGTATAQACAKIKRTGIKKLEAINDALHKAVETNKLQLTLIKNQEFHFEIYRASGNAILLPMIESLWLQGGPFIFYSLAAPKVVWDGSHHLNAIQALKDGDAEAAKKSIVDDIQVITNYLLKSHLFKRISPRPIR